jgi:hypothetical protein
MPHGCDRARLRSDPTSRAEEPPRDSPDRYSTLAAHDGFADGLPLTATFVPDDDVIA